MGADEITGGISQRVSFQRDEYETAALAVRHFAKKIRELKNDEDIPERENIVLEVDLNENAESMEHLATRLVESTRKDGPIMKRDKSQNEIICYALHVYAKDLQDSKKKILYNLGIKNEGKNFIITMKNLEQLQSDIRVAMDHDIFKCSSDV
jgi:hypothetical protein